MTRGASGGVAAAALVGLALANGAVWGGALLFFRPAAPQPALASPSSPTPSPSAPAQESPARLPVFAVSGGVEVRLLAPEVVAVAFHEASYGDATAMEPVGVCRPCRNRTKFTPPEPATGGLVYIVTESRGRATPATSAADIVLRRGSEVLAPVAGRVTRVKRYRLYGRYRDIRIVIRPDGVPDRRVVLLHLDRLRVRAGDRVGPRRLGSGRSAGSGSSLRSTDTFGGRYAHGTWR